MKRAAALLMLLAMPVSAGWQFSPAIEVGAADGKKLFHHLESANRKGLAESGRRIALVWEDNRAGEPRCWLAVREAGKAVFSEPQPISTGECFEPVVQGMGGGHFVTAWEEDGAVWIRAAEKGKALKLSKQEAAHVTLVGIDGQSLYAAWAERRAISSASRSRGSAWRPAA